MGEILGWETKTLQAAWSAKKQWKNMKKKERSSEKQTLSVSFSSTNICLHLSGGRGGEGNSRWCQALCYTLEVHDLLRFHNILVSPLLLFSHLVVSNSLRPHGLQRARLPRPSLSLKVCSKSCPLSQRCHPTILSSVILHFTNKEMETQRGQL